MKTLYLIVLITFIVSCQALKKEVSTSQNTHIPPPILPSIVPKHSSFEELNQPVLLKPQHGAISVRFNLSTPLSQSFKLQASELNQIAFIKVSVSASDISTPIYPTEASSDPDHLIAYAGNINSISIANIPFGSLRLLTIEAYNSSRVVISNLSLKTMFSLNSSSLSLSADSLTTLVATVLKEVETSSSTTAQQIDQTKLTTFISQLTELKGSSPNFTYLVHPVFIVTSAISTDLLSRSGNVDALLLDNPNYQSIGGKVTGTISGLIGNDQVNIQINDPASGILTQGNGSFTVDNIMPGTWKVLLSSTNYTTPSNPSPNITAGSTVDVGTLSLTPSNTPSITNLSSSNAKSGTTIQINGSNFHSQPFGNQVNFGQIPAHVTSASPTQLSVKVPVILSSTPVSISVRVSDKTSNTFNFTPGDFSVSWGLTAGPGQGEVLKLAGDPANSSILYAGTKQDGVYKTIDAGANWTAANDGIDSSAIKALGVNGTDIFASIVTSASPAPTEGVYRSNDGGANWTNINTGLPNLSINPIGSFAFDPANSSIIYAGTIGSGSAQGIFKSINGGTNWSSANDVNTQTREVHTIAISSLLPSTLYIGTNQGVYKTLTAGISWTQMNNGLGNVIVKHLLKDPNNDDLLYAGTSGAGIFKTINGGQSWFSINTGIPESSPGTPVDIKSIELDNLNPAILYFGSDSELGPLFFKSINGGSSWVPFTDTTFQANQTPLDILSTSNHLYTAQGSGVVLKATP